LEINWIHFYCGLKEGGRRVSEREGGGEGEGGKVGRVSKINTVLWNRAREGTERKRGREVESVR
jgi:hypothetical protein